MSISVCLVLNTFTLLLLPLTPAEQTPYILHKTLVKRGETLNRIGTASMTVQW